MTDFESEMLSISQRLGAAFREQDRAIRKLSNRLPLVSHNAEVLKAETIRMCELSSNP